jgi:hypothetical protein
VAVVDLSGDGTATGQFTCMVVDYVVVLGSFSTATTNADGSIQLQGTASLFFVDGTSGMDLPTTSPFGKAG